MITVDVDSMTPCLIDNATGDVVETECIRIRRKSFLEKFNERTGWYVNWAKLLDNNEVYALVVKGTVSIQGLVALQQDKGSDTVFVSWMVANPENNKEICGERKKYEGVGGHLFAIAIRRSLQLGCNGDIYGYAANKKLLKYYTNPNGPIRGCFVGALHPYHFVVDGKSAKNILEVYTYDWTDEEI